VGGTVSSVTLCTTKRSKKELGQIILKVGMFITLGSVFCSVLITTAKLFNLLRIERSAGNAVTYILSVFLTLEVFRDYLKLLRQSGKQPTTCDIFIHRLHVFIARIFVVGVLGVVVGLSLG